MNYWPEEVLVADSGFVCGADLLQDFFKQHATNNDEEEASFSQPLSNFMVILSVAKLQPHPKNSKGAVTGSKKARYSCSFDKGPVCCCGKACGKNVLYQSHAALQCGVAR